MTRTQCSAVIDYGRCKKKFRSRQKHQFCREHHRVLYGVPRPIESRTRSENKYRRNRKRRGVTTRVVPKVISNRNNIRGNNAISK